MFEQKIKLIQLKKKLIIPYLLKNAQIIKKDTSASTLTFNF